MIESSQTRSRRFGRRAWLGSAAAGLAASVASGSFAPASVGLEVGEGVVDTTPPIGIEMAGFHRAPGNERRIARIRQETAVRALVLRLGSRQVALVSVDICAISEDLAARSAAAVAKTCGIEAGHVHVTATHTHSMPTLRYFRQWGAVPEAYRQFVEKAIVRAVAKAQGDLAAAELFAGQGRTQGANFNRTTKTWQTDAQFGKGSTDAERWLDTTLHVLRFERRSRRPILWYHFSAHPVCYTDDAAGPDWPGLVANLVHERHHVVPAFLQGHIGDVNPGDGQPWLGIPEVVAERVYAGFAAALNSARSVPVKELRLISRPVELPFDMDRFAGQVAQYEKDPAACASGEWVDAGFAKDWYAGASRWDKRRRTLAARLSLVQLGDIGLIFHPAELYSYYGLAMRRDAGLPFTIVVGYTDGFVGYLTDPAAYTAGEYAAITVPKILDLPPFLPDAARALTAAAVDLV